jgi:molybdate transport system permease protein
VDWTALALSLRLGVLTVLLLLPAGVVLGRLLAFRRFPGKGFVEALIALPLVLPPTVLGYYLLVAFGGQSPVGQGWQALFGHSLVFSFEGLLLASLIANLPFAIQPMQRGFEAIPPEVREAASCSGMSPLKVLLAIELPLRVQAFDNHAAAIMSALLLALSLAALGITFILSRRIGRRYA